MKERPRKKTSEKSRYVTTAFLYLRMGSWVMGRSDAHVATVISSLQVVHCCSTGNMVYHVVIHRDGSQNWTIGYTVTIIRTSIHLLCLTTLPPQTGRLKQCRTDRSKQSFLSGPHYRGKRSKPEEYTKSIKAHNLILTGRLTDNHIPIPTTRKNQ